VVWCCSKTGSKTHNVNLVGMYRVHPRTQPKQKKGVTTQQRCAATNVKLSTFQKMPAPTAFALKRNYSS
jgi:cytochrome c